jgi:hypothetical protein
MKAIETTATLTEDRQLTLDQPILLTHHNRVRVIVLIPDDDENADDSIETIREGIYPTFRS